jgi:hypothetical protein
LIQQKNLTASSGGKYYSDFTGLGTGSYIANVTAQYSGSTNYCTDTFSILSTITCNQKTISISGYALDALTGQTVSGTVKLIIKETGDSKEFSFSNGYWSTQFVTCLDSGNRYTLGIKVEDSEERSSWTQIKFKT